MNVRTDPAQLNPLLDFTDLPRFDAITPEAVEPAIDALLDEADRALRQATAADFPAQWSALASTLDVATERLSRAWGAVSHLNSVADTPALRAAYNAALPKVTEFWTRLGADERLYAKYKAMDPAALTAEQARARENALRGFVLGGAELQGEGALCRHSGAVGRAGAEVQRERSRCHRRLFPVRARGRTGRCARGRGAGHGRSRPR
jgi:oligopeptidase A